jgi:hypothetical protein
MRLNNFLAVLPTWFAVGTALIGAVIYLGTRAASRFADVNISPNSTLMSSAILIAGGAIALAILTRK